MNRLLLSVVVPTRNRHASLERLLKSLSLQTLSPDAFEVIVVDDNSSPALDEAQLSRSVAFPLRVVRRTGMPGAHESRCAGVNAANGARVLFLDDDVDVSSQLLSEHASVDGAFAVGPILYHPDSHKTPYQRFQTRQYADYAATVTAQGPYLPASQIYICNSSGPTVEFAEVLRRVRDMVDTSVPGDGCDEEMIDFQLRHLDAPARFLVNAGILHIDTKTLRQARDERRANGSMQCRLMLDVPEIRDSFNSYSVLTGKPLSYRTLRARLVWATPTLFAAVGKFFTMFGDRAKWAPALVCYPPLAIAYWEGMRSYAPSFSSLRSALMNGSREG